MHPRRTPRVLCALCLLAAALTLGNCCPPTVLRYIGSTWTPTVPPTPAPTRAPAPTRTSTPIPYRPPNGMLSPGPSVPTGQQAGTTVVVKNGTDGDALVVLLSMSTGERVAAYVWSGESCKIDLGFCSGDYEVYFCKGRDWDQDALAFTRNVTYSKVQRRLACGGVFQIMSYELTLYGIVGGDAPIDTISGAQFPDVEP